MPTFTSHLYRRFIDQILNSHDDTVAALTFAWSNHLPNEISEARRREEYFSQIRAMGYSESVAQSLLDAAQQHSQDPYRYALRLAALGQAESLPIISHTEPNQSVGVGGAGGLYQTVVGAGGGGLYQTVASNPRRVGWYIDEVLRTDDEYYHPEDTYIPVYSSLSISVCICELCARPDNGHSILLKDGDSLILEMSPQIWNMFGQESALSQAQDKMDKYARTNNVI